MAVFDVFRQEHEVIERELLELEAIMQADMVNYPNLIHVVKKVTYLFEHHARRENEFFRILEEQGVATPVREMLYLQQEIDYHLQTLTKAMLLSSDYRTRDALLNHGEAFILKVRQHIQQQDWVFYALSEPTVEQQITGMPRMRPQSQREDLSH